MKKIISLMLITIMILAATVLPSFAAEMDGAFTAEDAVKLFEDAETLYLTLENTDTGRNSELKLDITDYKENFDEAKLDQNTDLSYYRHYKVISYNYGNLVFEINNREDLEKLIGLYFTEDVAKKYIEDFQAYRTLYPYQNAVATPLFFDENNTVYHLCKDISHQIKESYAVIGYSDFVCNESQASINFTLSRTRVPLDNEYLSLPVEFVKTESGWRMSKDVFNSILHNCTGNYEGSYREYLIENPNTGDTTSTTVAILATIALAAVTTPFALSKKRRAR